MYTYRCPECGKQHGNPDAFAEGYRATCLRCSHTFEVKRETARAVAGGESSAGRERAIETPPRTAVRASPAAPRLERTRVAAKKVKAGASAEEAIAAMDVTPEELESLERVALPCEMKEDDATKKPASDDPAGTNKKPWLRWAAVFGPVLLVCGVGGYFVFGRSGAAKPPVAKAAPKPKPPAKAAPPKKVEEKKPAPAPAPAPPPVAVEPAIAFTISAPRLAAEVASDPGKADRDYKDARIEVSGLFDKLDAVKPAKGNPVTYALFLTEQGQVACDLSDALPAEMPAWRALQRGKPFNVRGVYTTRGVLAKSRLAETRARAEAIFGGKPVELRGLVDAVLPTGPGVEFPTVRLEVGTDSRLSLVCLFRKEDAPQVKVVKEGASVLIKGDCAGRRLEGDKYLVRIDNCEFVSTTGPAPSVPRLSPIDLAREFEEDLRTYYFPPPAPRDPAAPALTVTQLGKEWKADDKALAKYRGRILRVTGRPGKKAPGRLILESPETNQPLVVSCRFGRAIRDRLADLPSYTFTGVCTGMEGTRTLRLDDCGADASQLEPDGPRLTADYLPHKPGSTSIYDFVGHPVAGKKPAMINRQVWLRRENGVTETVITHTARFAGESLFSSGSKENWIDNARTTRIRLPGPVYVQKATPVAIELGNRVAQPKGGTKVETRLVVKLGVKAGDSWEWAGEHSKHVYTLVRFDRWRGKPSAVVKEVIQRPGEQVEESEVEHVFVRDVGEVERREWLRITSTEPRLIWESKMILGEPGPGKPPPAVKAPAK